MGRFNQGLGHDSEAVRVVEQCERMQLLVNYWECEVRDRRARLRRAERRLAQLRREEEMTVRPLYPLYGALWFVANQKPSLAAMVKKLPRPVRAADSNYPPLPRS